MRPVCRLTIDGQPVSDFFWSRLISVTVTDQEGVESDTIDVDIEAGPPFIALPREKAVIKCWLGYGANPTYMGAFEVEEPTLHFSALSHPGQCQGARPTRESERASRPALG